MASKITDAMKKTFSPEFINRIDDAVVFHALTKEDITGIIEIVLDEFKKRLEDRDMSVRVTPGAKNLIAEKGFDQTYGARYLKRTIQRLLEDPLAEEILQGRFVDGSRIRVTKKGDSLVFDDEREPAEAVEETEQEAV
jgi:ATP-dependent Clp protease ATP-binding subunit ClpA